LEKPLARLCFKSEQITTAVKGAASNRISKRAMTEEFSEQ
jgi:hypothetical protein